MMDQMASGLIASEAEYVPYYTRQNVEAMLNGDPTDGWGMPSYLWIADVTDPANVNILSNAVYDNLDDQIISGGTENSSLDVLPVVDGNDLIVYFVDSFQGHLAKVRFPKLQTQRLSSSGTRSIRSTILHVQSLSNLWVVIP